MEILVLVLGQQLSELKLKKNELFFRLQCGFVDFVACDSCSYKVFAIRGVEMINEIKVTNFRSITNDKIKIRSDITTIIGANGTGKTNLILALKFISACLSESPVRAIQRAGGLDKVFSVRERRAQKCSFQISIGGDLNQKSNKESSPILPYSEAIYFFELMYDEALKGLRVSKEKLVFKTAASPAGITIFERLSLPTGNKFSGHFRSLHSEHNLEFTFQNIDPKMLLLARFHMQQRSGPIGEVRNSMREVWRQLVSIVGYNFDPQALRRSADLLSANELSYDGKGFAAIINRLRDNDFALIRSRFGYQQIDGAAMMNQLSEVYEDVLPFLAEMRSTEAIDTTTVNLEFREKHQLKTQRHFNSEHLSDGTMKFLAIATAILLPGYNLLFIEEIENYLNPKAIRKLIQLMRDNANPHKRYVLTTHSETVLNLMMPDEILISNRDEDGSTMYRQFEQLKDIKTALDKSGMSLGTIWGKGGLDAF